MDDLSRRLQIELARTVFDDEYAELRNARLGPAPFAYRQPDEVLRHAHENLIATSKQTDGQPRYRKIVVAAGSKHSSNKVQSELTPEPVGKLRLGCANRGQRSPASFGHMRRPFH